jgi:hypothetical protein
MTFARAIIRDAVAGVAFPDKLEDLAVIKEPDCAAAIWRRLSDHGFQPWLDTLAPDQLPNGRIVLRPSAVPDAITQLCEISGAPNGAERAQLIDDVANLADVFADLMQAQFLRLRLQAVKNNACRKFHIDAITARLICTYRGTGTQYGVSSNLVDPECIMTVPTGAPIVLRGSLWPENPASGLVHRSPPIEGTGATRFVLVLDPISEGDALL